MVFWVQDMLVMLGSCWATDAGVEAWGKRMSRGACHSWWNRLGNKARISTMMSSREVVWECEVVDCVVVDGIWVLWSGSGGAWGMPPFNVIVWVLIDGVCNYDGMFSR